MAVAHRSMRLVLAVFVFTLSCSNEVSRDQERDVAEERRSQMFSDDPNRAGPDGHPIIFTVIEKADDTVRVRELIEAGANIEARGYGQGTPILMAAISENWRVVEVLLEAGADPMIPDEFGFTVTYMAATSRLRPESLEGQALDRVREVLEDRGIIGIVVPPREVEKMMEEGSWPPTD